MADISIRNLKLGDFQGLFRLVRSIYKEDPDSMWFRKEPSEESFRILFDNKMKGFEENILIDLVAMSENEMVGECEIAVQVPDLAFLGVIIDKKHRKQGLGNSLVTKALENARRLGVKHINVEVSEKNKEALSFFKRLDFKVQGISDRNIENSNVLVLQRAV